MLIYNRNLNDRNKHSFSRQKLPFSEKLSSQTNLAIFSGQLSYLLGPSKLSSFFLPYFSGFCSIVRSTTNSVAMANAIACNNRRNSMRWPSQPIALKYMFQQLKKNFCNWELLYSCSAINKALCFGNELMVQLLWECLQMFVGYGYRTDLITKYKQLQTWQLLKWISIQGAVSDRILKRPSLFS